MSKQPMSTLHKYLLTYLIREWKRDFKQEPIGLFNRLWRYPEHPEELLPILALPRLETMREIYGFLQVHWGETLNDYPEPNLQITQKVPADQPQMNLALSLKRQLGFHWDITGMGKNELGELIRVYQTDGSA